tara:strand:- start:84 stop:404 length:321 start_codon:yes stop_codon:yes gene_type:complete
MLLAGNSASRTQYTQTATQSPQLMGWLVVGSISQVCCSVVATPLTVVVLEEVDVAEEEDVDEEPELEDKSAQPSTHYSAPPSTVVQVWQTPLTVFWTMLVPVEEEE